MLQDLTAGSAAFELVEDSTFSLRLPDVQVTDAGTYVVVASNKHGTAQRTMSLQVAGKGTVYFSPRAKARLTWDMEGPRGKGIGSRGYG